MFVRPLVLGALGTVGLTLYRGLRRTRQLRRSTERTRERLELARWEGEGGALTSGGGARAAHAARG